LVPFYDDVNSSDTESELPKQASQFENPSGQDWAKEIKLLRFDHDITRKFGFKAARFVVYLECMLSGKVGREPGKCHYTYDPAWLVCKRTRLTPATFERVVGRLVEAKFVKVRRMGRNIRSYAFHDQVEYIKSRSAQKRLYARLEDVDQFGEPVAILLYNLRYWTKHNGQERGRLFKGRYWRYDSIAELGHQLGGILTIEQIRNALTRMVLRKLIDKIAYYDAHGVRQVGRFWITLLEVAAVADRQPDNKVRPESLFAQDGNLHDKVSVPAASYAEVDNTRSDRDKTDSEYDKTDAAENLSLYSDNQEDTSKPDSPLNSSHLNISSEVAAAPSSFITDNGEGNLQQLDEAARPAASREPSAPSADRPIAGEPFDLRRSNIVGDLYRQIESLKRQLQALSLSVHLDRAKPVDAEGNLEHQVDLFQRIPRSDLRKCRMQFTRDYEQARQELGCRSSNADKRRLQEEVDQYNKRRVPRECFSHRFSDPRLACQECAWKQSCEVATPEKIKQAIREMSYLDQPRSMQARDQERPENVAEIYRQAYLDVFGKEAPDTVGKAVKILNNAQSVKLGVRAYLLVYMTLWARTHPLGTFYSKFASGDVALEHVRVVLDVCSRKFGVLLEDRLAMVLNLRFLGGEPLWRHQPTATERFMIDWQASWKVARGGDYIFTKAEINQLIGCTIELPLRSVERLIDDAVVWMSKDNAPCTLSQFLSDLQENPHVD
jgi:hypothetical protein